MFYPTAILKVNLFNHYCMHCLFFNDHASFFLTLSPFLLPLFLPTAFKVTLHPQKKWMA